jgi:quercetin dioxygenase-like cupin family protein
MAAELQISYPKEVTPTNPFLRCELVPGHDPYETALEVALFDFHTTHHEMGARVIFIPANRAFARHIHPNAHHFIYVIQGTGIVEYDGETYTLQAGGTCLVCRGIEHKLGAGDDGLLAIVVNTPTYENGDPKHVHYTEEETLENIEIS